MSRECAIQAKSRIMYGVAMLLFVIGSSVFLASCSSTSGTLAGTVATVDVAGSAFVLTPKQSVAGLTNLTVTVGPQTEFRGALHGLSDLQTGMTVRVQGTAQSSSGTLAAVEVEDEPVGDRDVGSATQNGEHGDAAGAAKTEGTIASVDDTQFTFTLKLADGTLKTVTVSMQTEFEGTLHRFADLVTGQRVSVRGALQADASILASSVEAESDDMDDDGGRVELTGTVSNVDPAHSSFALTLADSTLKTVVVNVQTQFDGGLNGFGDLTKGAHVEVRGALQSDGSLVATRVHREDDGDDVNGDDGHHDSPQATPGSDDGPGHD